MGGESNIIRNVVQWETVGAQAVARDAAAVKDANVNATKAINDANTAVGNLNTGLQDVDFAPLNQSATDFWQPVNAANEKAQKSIKETGGKLGELGEAGQQAKQMLDQLVPGLGGIFESLTAMNPVAIAGTIALTGVAAAFGELQRQAEELKAASEAAVKAESERVVSLLNLDEKLNLAQSGNEAARRGLLDDYAAEVDRRNELMAKETNLIEQNNAAQRKLDEALQATDDALNNLNLFDQSNLEAAAAAETQARADRDAAAQALRDMNAEVVANRESVEDLNAALNELGITEAERNALLLTNQQGAEGAAAALDTLAQNAEDAKDKLTELGTSVADGFKDLVENIAGGIQKAAEEAAKAREAAEKRLIDINEDLTEAEEERGKVLADRLQEEQRGKELGALQDRLAIAQAVDAAAAKNQKLAELESQARGAQVAATQKFMEDQQKLLANYIKAEQNATEDYSRERVRKLEDLYNTLSNLASQRDVAGFVNARASGMLGINRGDEDAGVAARRRREAFDAQQADLVAAFQKESATRQSQLNQRIQQEQSAGQQQIKQADIVNRQIAELRQRYAEQDLRARRMQEDATYKSTIDILQKKRMDELKITGSAANAVIDIINRIAQAASRANSSSASQTTTRRSSGGMQAYDEGSPYIPHDQVALLHKGERVMTAAENARYMRSGSTGGAMGSVTINMSVGEFATPSQVAAVKTEIVSAITSFAANN
jgi:hypothetical protein